MHVHSHVIPSFEWGLEADGGAVVRIKARKRGRWVKRVEAAHLIQASCCRMSRAEGGGKGQGGYLSMPPTQTRGPRPYVSFACPVLT